MQTNTLEIKKYEEEIAVLRSRIDALVQQDRAKDEPSFYVCRRCGLLYQSPCGCGCIMLVATRPDPHGWQPIETYEHGDRAEMGDGVLVATADGVVGEAYFNPTSGGGSWWWSGTHDGEYADSAIFWPITHWMPLPPAPVSMPDPHPKDGSQ